jgi:hypothetical protein
METAKVDIRRLQTLSDCINRTIEALNQVRLSVHAGNLPYAQLGLQGAGAPFFGAFPGAFAVAPQLMGQVPGVFSGIAHSAASPFINQFAVNPWSNLAQLQNAAAQNAFAQNAFAQNAFANTPFNALNGNSVTPFAQTGLGHSAFSALNNTAFGNSAFNSALNNEFVDPYTTARIAQTFPFVHWGYSPFGWPTV